MTIPGVPPLLNGVGASASAVLLTADSIANLLGFGLTEQWGIFLDGSPVVIADTVTTFEFKKESSISDYPIEGGKFESYNKVMHPFEVEITLCAGGSDNNRAAFLASIDEILDDYNLYSVVSPERIYRNCNVMRSNYRRTTTNGRGILSVPVRLREIRISTPSSGSNTAQPDGASAINGGSVQTSTPSSSQMAATSGIQ
jgi:hypothetical protein